MAGVRIQRLSKRYENGALVLRDVNLEIAEGEFVVLVGPSGCGKSTLLRMIAGLEEVTTGSIQIGAREVSQVPPSERGIAMVFQDYALYPHMSVRDNLSFGLRMRKRVPLSREEIERRVSAAASLLGLDDLLERKPAMLSGGQRQRVALARALVKEPQVFLFDEPLSNLDAQLRASTRIEIAALHRRLGSTSIYVTHDQAEAMTLADRLVILKDGVIQQIGAPLEVYRKPINQFVASFLGSPGMNFLAVGEKVFGVRPESVRLVRQGGRLPARVVWVETHGYELQVVVDVDGARWVARTPSTDLRAGDSCFVDWSSQDGFWFDAESGRRYTSGIWPKNPIDPRDLAG